jgi:cytochrome c-type biogenesis protein CcmH/NrfF
MLSTTFFISFRFSKTSALIIITFLMNEGKTLKEIYDHMSDIYLESLRTQPPIWYWGFFLWG